MIRLDSISCLSCDYVSLCHLPNSETSQIFDEIFLYLKGKKIKNNNAYITLILIS